jgi:uncharacterized protein (TIGR00730 family)
MQRICIFCGSYPGTRPAYLDAARHMGTVLAQRGIGLVYGGGHVGLMGTVADAVLEHGGEVIGVIPQALVDRELAHKGLTELRIVNSMHERKAMMADLAEAFIALPGGFGTFEEFFEILTWGQLGFHRKPCSLLNIEHYYDPLLSLFDHAVTEGFVDANHRSLVIVAETPGRLLDLIDAYEPPKVIKWVSRDET